MTFTLTIELGNDAMQTPQDVAPLLLCIGHQLSAGGAHWNEPMDSGGSLRDANGNTVGQWRVE